jgi:hypothetical protein
MSDLIPKNTDEEMERYMEADMIRRARMPMEGNAALKFEADPITGRENAYFPLSAGGYVKIGDRAVTPVQAAETDGLAAEREIQNDARGPINEVMGGADGPVMDDYLAAGFTEADVREYQAQERARMLAQPGTQVPVQLTPEQVQMGVDVGAPMLAKGETDLRDRVQSSIFNAMSATEEPKGPVGEAVRYMLQGITGSELIDPSDLRFWSNYLTDVVDITVPGVGGALSLDEGASIVQQGYQTGNAVDMLIGGLVFGMGALELVPMVKNLTRPARQALAENLSPAAKNLLADTVGASRAIAQGDREMLMEIFQPAGTPRSLGAAGTGMDDAALTRNTQEYLSQIGVEAAPSRGGFAGRISTRLPTAARATEDPMTGELIIGYDELRADPKVFEPNVNIVRDYPNMRPQPDATTDETAEQFITHVKDNLLYLHDQVPEATRTRSQLWYDGARNITDRWSREYGSPDTSIAGALAALSPQKDWYQNVSLAQRVLDVAARQQDFRMSNEMRGLFFTLRDAKGNPVFDKPKYVPLLESIDGKAYSEIVDDDPMAIDPTALAEEQVQRQALAAQGAPTEFAQGPEQAVRVAGPAAEGMRELLSRLSSSVQKSRPSGQPVRPPTPQEQGIVEQPGTLSMRGAAAEAAPEVLSDQGLQRFEAMQYRAPTPAELAAGQTGPQAPNDVLQSATEALDAQATEATQQAKDLRTGAQRALTAEQRGFGPESGVAPEQITDEVLAQLSAEELNIKSLADGGDFNFDYLTTPDSVKATITAVGEVLAAPQAAVTRGIRTNEVTTQEAARLAADEIGMTRTLLSRKIGDGALNAEQMVAARELLVRSATRLTDLAELVKGGQATAADRLAFRRQLAIHSGIQLQLKGAQTEAARALQSFRIPVSGELDAAGLNAEAQRLIQEGNLDESTNALAERLLATSALPENERLAAINRLTERGWYAKTKGRRA